MNIALVTGSSGLIGGESVEFFAGKFDKVIPPVIGKQFVKGLKNKKSLHIVEAGHQMVNEKLNAELEKVLTS